jgi:hypothetical protein
MINIDWNNKIEVLKEISNDGWALEFASDELKNDKEVVLKAVWQDGIALQFASDKLKNDKEVLLVAVSYNDNALKYASDELKDDLDYIKQIYNCKNYKQVYEYIKRTDEIKKFSYRKCHY